MVKRMNKKAAEGDFRNVMVGLIISIIFLILVGYFLFNASDAGKTVGQNVPSKVELVRISCGAAANNKLVESYCYQIRSIDKDEKVWVTCPYAVTDLGVQPDISDGNNVPVCNADTKIKRVDFYASELSLSSDVLIDGSPRSTYGGAVSDAQEDGDSEESDEDTDSGTITEDDDPEEGSA